MNTNAVELAVISKTLDELKLDVAQLKKDEAVARGLWKNVALVLLIPTLGIAATAGALQSQVSAQSQMLREIRESLPRIADHEARIRVLESRPH